MTILKTNQLLKKGILLFVIVFFTWLLIGYLMNIGGLSGVTGGPDRVGSADTANASEAMKNEYPDMVGIAYAFAGSLITTFLFFLFLFNVLRPLRRSMKFVRQLDEEPASIPGHSPDDLPATENPEEDFSELVQRFGESSRNQRIFFASASHELKTPLALMRAQLETALIDPYLGPEIHSLLQSQLAEIQRLQEVIRKFLVVSQLRAKSLAVHKKEVDFCKLVLVVFGQFKSVFEERNLRSSIIFDEECDDYFVQVDDDLLRIAIMNVVENAGKYAVAGSTVLFTVSRAFRAGTFEIFVSNEIAAEQLVTDQLKLAFVRSESFETGSGLGLWLADQVVVLHKGMLELESSGHHFRLRMTLPC